MFTKTSLHDYENLCSLNCLGIEEKHEQNNEFIYREFRTQLGRDSLGTMKPTLSGKKISNEVNSLGRLHSLTKDLIRSNKLGEYDKIIQEQINEGIIEKVSETKTSEKGKELYLPHRPVIRELSQIFNGKEMKRGFEAHMILYLSLSNLFYNDILKVYTSTQLNLADELAKLKGNIESSKESLKELFNESLSKMQDDELLKKVKTV